MNPKQVIISVSLVFLFLGCAVVEEVKNETPPRLQAAEAKVLAGVRTFELVRKGGYYSLKMILLDQDGRENSFNGTINVRAESAGKEVYAVRNLSFDESMFSVSTTLHFDGRPLERHLNGRLNLPGNFSQALCSKGVAEAEITVGNVTLFASNENVSVDMMYHEDRQEYFESLFNNTAAKIGLCEGDGIFNVTVEKIGAFGVDCGFPEGGGFAAYISVFNLASVPKPFHAGGVVLFTSDGVNYTGYGGRFSGDVAENSSGFVFFDAPRNSTPLMLEISQLRGEPVESYFLFNVSKYFKK